MTKKISHHPSLLYEQEIAAICYPLQKLNISYFAHVKIDDKKRFSAISNNPTFAQHYLENKYYLADIHMVDQNKFGNFFVWDGIEFTGRSAQMCEEAGAFGIHHPFTIIQKNKDSIDYFHFASQSKDKQINQVYLANLDLLNLFISYFQENINQSKSLIRAYDFTFNLGFNPIAFEKDPAYWNKLEFKQILETSKKLDKLKIGNAILSRRQSEILRFIIQGKTIKEIALVLGLSYRTVGHYFEAIKAKLNVSSKSELISKSFDFDITKILSSL
jgi:DNA-binding CsgD family transcriptional regulator